MDTQSARIIPHGKSAPGDRVLNERLATIRKVHTLGPSGTNCERAAQHWLSHNTTSPELQVFLYPTLEEAAEHVLSPDDALLGCVVYPKLNNIVFDNLHRFVIGDIFLLNTHTMVLAKRPEADTIRSVATHPAPHPLIPIPIPDITFVNSNIEAALVCKGGKTDACVTTLPAASRLGLEPVVDFGPVSMGFTIHILR